MKRFIFVAVIIMSMIAAYSHSDDEGHMMGSGMMDSPGYGNQGRAGDHDAPYGMMRGGMMGYGGYGMGPGMMGYGMMGPGMMGYGGYGMGPGMMGYGNCGMMGPGMMGRGGYGMMGRGMMRGYIGAMMLKPTRNSWTRPVISGNCFTTRSSNILRLLEIRKLPEKPCQSWIRKYGTFKSRSMIKRPGSLLLYIDNGWDIMSQPFVF
jgi:hypothetical protein